MKLDGGQRMAPVPCPIHSKPMASARKPMIESDLAMDFPPVAVSCRLNCGWCGSRGKPLPAAAVASDRIQSRPAAQDRKSLHCDLRAIMNRRTVILALAAVLAVV